MKDVDLLKLISMKKLILSILLSIHFLSIGQTSHQIQIPTKEVLVIPYWGTFVSGYVDRGAFVNFTGPALGYGFGKSQILIGMLPSLRFKEDSGTTKNSVVIPTLGFGITYTYKSLAFQVPLYYTTKTSTSNGKWNIGLGLGIKMSAIRFKKDS